MRNFDCWAVSYRNYLSGIKNYRIVMKKIFTKKGENFSEDFSNVFLDDNRDVYYKEKLNDQICFCVSNEHKENFLVSLK